MLSEQQRVMPQGDSPGQGEGSGKDPLAHGARAGLGVAVQCDATVPEGAHVDVVDAGTGPYDMPQARERVELSLAETDAGTQDEHDRVGGRRRVQVRQLVYGDIGQGAADRVRVRRTA
nr:hypothetical protein [Streptomyces griseus]